MKEKYEIFYNSLSRQMDVSMVVNEIGQLTISNDKDGTIILLDSEEVDKLYNLICENFKD